MAADLQGMITDLPATLVWGSQSVSVVAGDLSKSNALEMFGVAMENGIAIVALKASFSGSTYPPVNTVVAVNGQSVRIISALVGADNVSVTLTAERVSG
jgi:hypothetical protein